MLASRQWLVGPNAILLLSRSSMRATAKGHQHFDGLNESGKTIPLSGPGADGALLFAVVRIKHRSSLAFVVIVFALGSPVIFPIP